jgi:molybdenum cofactor synthesis domain-containing protein
MLNVKTVTEVNIIIENFFGKNQTGIERVHLVSALDRVLAKDIFATEFVPNFDRSTVDGYAVKALDVFGCSDSIPAMLTLAGESIMGEHISLQLNKGQCVYVHTGSEIPMGADAVVMLEDAEDFKNCSIAIYKPCAPGSNMLYRGDDVKPGDCILSTGKRITIADVGTLASMGITDVPVMKRPRVAILSTGDELVPAGDELSIGQIRDVNGPLLVAAVKDCGGEPWFCGIIKDDEQAILAAIVAVKNDYDILIISGGTSVGVKDSIPAAISKLGELMVHGVAAKPGKPTIIGRIEGKPVFGLPGNPMAAYFMFHVLVRPLLYSIRGLKIQERYVLASISRAVTSNHGREEFVPVSLKAGIAQPIASKSGLITILSRADGFIRVPRDCEGLKQGESVDVELFER